MNVAELEQLVHLVQNANIHELTLRHNGARVTIRKSPRMAAEMIDGGPLAMAKTEAEVTGSAPSAEADLLPESDHTIPVKSPLVGTFKATRTPVALATLVQAGQVIAIIEAMKLPNEVTAPCAGRVVEVFVEEGQFVEYGQELFALEPEK